VIAWATVLASLAAHVAAAVWLYRTFRAKVAAGKMTAPKASWSFFLVMIAIPYPLMWLDFRIGWHLYSNLPAIFDPAWDVGTALLSVFIGLGLSAIISLSFAIFAAWKFSYPWAQKSDASAT